MAVAGHPSSTTPLQLSSIWLPRSKHLASGPHRFGALVGAVIVSKQSSCGGDSSPHPDCSDLAYAVLVPSVIAMGIDWFSARDAVLVPEPRGAAFAPHLIIKPGLALMGLGGTF
ncbi:MAG TPA: hypothetical protein VHG72_10240 [Polyangia bacterium]|nr:hypothetical protein [Polyangia bacterium]